MNSKIMLIPKKGILIDEDNFIELGMTPEEIKRSFRNPNKEVSRGRSN